MKNLPVKTDTKNELHPNSCRSGAMRQNPGREPSRESDRPAASFGELVRRIIGRGFQIREEVIIIGRNYDCDLRIEKPFVSGVYAVISRENGCLVLEYLGGRHGTRVNRVAVDRMDLSDGDRIHIGRAELVFRSG
jgi:pSer/pThr/pTyr-binding forkhead associated (FHA) protein